jgi:hypothetical protein
MTVVTIISSRSHFSVTINLLLSSCRRKSVTIAITAISVVRLAAMQTRCNASIIESAAVVNSSHDGVPENVRWWFIAKLRSASSFSYLWSRIAIQSSYTTSSPAENHNSTYVVGSSTTVSSTEIHIASSYNSTLFTPLLKNTVIYTSDDAGRRYISVTTYTDTNWLHVPNILCAQVVVPSRPANPNRI